MKRALILIVVLTLGSFGCGSWLDHLQQKAAQQYLDGFHAVRRLIEADDMDAAAREQAYLHALWQKDAHWLNVLLDHHHTRDVNPPCAMCPWSSP